MSKKNNKGTIKKKSTAKKKAVSLSSKTKKSTRRKSIHKTSPKVTHLYDNSIPVSLLFSGIVKNLAAKEKEPQAITVQMQKHTVSPHVIQLREMIEERVEEILPSFEEFAANIRANIEATKENVPVPVVSEIADEEVLDLSSIENQLAENDLNERVSFYKKFTLPKFSFPKLHLPKVDAPKLHIPKPSLPKMQMPKIRIKRQRRSIIEKIESAFSFRLALSPSLRGVAAFVLISFVFVLPLQAMSGVGSASRAKANVYSDSDRAFSALKDAASATARVDFVEAGHNFREASEAFAAAQTTLSHLSNGTAALARLLPSKNKAFRTGQALLSVGEELSESAELVARGFQGISELVDPALGTKISLLSKYVTAAIPHLEASKVSLLRVDPEQIPEEHLEYYNLLANSIPELLKSFKDLNDFSGALETILGNDEKKSYLFVFQNDTEARATGGFIGSFAEVDIYRGEIESITIPGGGSYDLQGSLGKQVAAPKPLQLINPRWEFQDANWFPEFEKSAKKLLEFHESAGGPTMDGVIAINASFVTELLKLTGPIEMPEYGRVIDSENFLFETQKIVELEYDREENKPKQFLADLTPKLLERMKDADAELFVAALAQMSQSLAQKDIQLYFTNYETQTQMNEFGWTGNLARTTGDYLMVVNSNLGGGKTDIVIDEDVELHSEIKADGRILNTVTIAREHHGIPGALFSGVNNVNYTRIYVPRGSKLVHSTGATPPLDIQFELPEDYFEVDADLAFIDETREVHRATGTNIHEESGKTVFGNWMQTMPGQTSTLTFTYELPWRFKITDEEPSLLKKISNFMGFIESEAHTVTIEPQSGATNRAVSVEVVFPEHLSVLWSTDLVDYHSIQSEFSGNSPGFVATIFE